MDSTRSQDSIPTNTTNAQLLSAIEALLFVVVGVVAVRLPVLFLVPSLLAIVGALLLIRWMNAAPARTREATAYLWHRYEHRGLLLEDLQEILSHEREERWRYRDLVSAVHWWFDDDLYAEYMMDRYGEREGPHQESTPARRRVSLRARLTGFRYGVKRRLEGTMTRRPQLIDAVARAGSEEVARIVLTRALAEGFVCERLEAGEHRARITYSLNVDALRTPARDN